MLSTGSSAPGAYTSVVHGVREILRSEGPRGFYRGLLPALLGVSHGAVQFVAYERLKSYRLGQKLRGTNEGNSNPSDGGPSKPPVLSNSDYLACSAVSKSLAGTITYPYQVVKARLQTYDAGTTYKSATDVVVQLWRREGASGFYKGLGPNIVRVLPATCVTFVVYENTKYYLQSLK
ncbi:MAG: hypothetical protein M1819_001325 [Sarea resinae]|nr:MAG: hypothetical protein M1819_001325 [Sarea resinae]